MPPGQWQRVSSRRRGFSSLLLSATSPCRSNFVLGLLANVVAHSYGQGQVVEGEQSSAEMLDDYDIEGADPAPEAHHWVLAVFMAIVLVAGLVRVYQVLRRADALNPSRRAPEGMRPVECGYCRTTQHVIMHGRIFICFICHSPNRIPLESLRAQAEPVLAEAHGPLRRFKFKRGGDNFFQEIERETMEDGEEIPAPTLVGNPQVSETQSNSSKMDDGTGLPTCAVCFDNPGDIVLLPCAHGRVCEECATRIAQNRASGGSHCPHCRSNIELLVKIHNIDIETGEISGVEHRIPIARQI
eukprot:gnl/TRDRNA2_/TRDRNA2_44846_c0_seq1.p1 gnl/TRDRNA2_/TRDRNA2_44846_c0~~gnl/TRDRNA2_/TRDRNA2_44846_c0_seq1.p1  ORF type:complete len:299 (-),score=24.89 gnl/TRDRNA2_/TRDRNA2_44846_c0_seq1:224-1120(-)